MPRDYLKTPEQLRVNYAEPDTRTIGRPAEGPSERFKFQRSTALDRTPAGEVP